MTGLVDKEALLFIPVEILHKLKLSLVQLEIGFSAQILFSFSACFRPVKIFSIFVCKYFYQLKCIHNSV